MDQTTSRNVYGGGGGVVASVPGLPCYVHVLICGGGNNAVNLKTGKAWADRWVCDVAHHSSPGESQGQATVKRRGMEVPATSLLVMGHVAILTYITVGR